MLKAKVSFLKEDFKSAFELHYTSTFPVRSRLLMFFGLFLIVIGVFLLFAQNKFLPYLPYIFIGLGGFYLVFYYYRKKGVIDNALRNPGLSGEHEIEISESGIKFQGEKGLSNMPWEKIVRAESNSDTVLFYFGENQFYIIPKKLFNQEELVKLDGYVKKVTAE